MSEDMNKFDNSIDSKNHNEKEVSEHPTYRTHRSGNTFRFTGSKQRVLHTSPGIEFGTNHCELIEHGNGYIEVPITDCDLLFDDFSEHLTKKIEKICFGQKSKGYYSPREPEYTLNKGASWKIIDFLEDQCSKKHSTTSTRYGHIEHKTQYQLPIVAKRILTKNARNGIKHQSNTQLRTFNNKTYKLSANMIYRLTGDTIGVGYKYNFADTPIGITTINFTIKSNQKHARRWVEKAIIDNKKVWSRDDNKLIDSPSYYYKADSYLWTQYHYLPMMKNASVILDMGTNTKVKYISTMGRPLQIRSFPVKHIDGEDYPKSDYTNPIIVLDEGEFIVPDFVKRFSLHGRVDGGAWVPFGNFVGNFDRLSEKLNNITNDIPNSFAPRYLKFTALDVVDTGCVRFMLYGDAIDLPKRDAKLFADQHCVTYSVIHKNEHPLTRDGFIVGFSDSQWRSNADKRSKRSLKLNLRSDLGKIVKKYNANLNDLDEIESSNI